MDAGLENSGESVNPPAENTDRELYREPKGDLPSDYYAPYVFVTRGGKIGMAVDGLVYTAPIRDWHREYRMGLYGAGTGLSSFREALEEIDAIDVNTYEGASAIENAYNDVVSIVNRVLHGHEDVETSDG